MTETLLSPSNVLLFGRKVRDLRVIRPKRRGPSVKVEKKVRLVSIAKINLANAPARIDGVNLADKDLVLLVGQESSEAENGVYEFTAGTPATLVRVDATNDNLIADKVVYVKDGKSYSKSYWQSTTPDTTKGEPFYFVPLEQFKEDPRHGPFVADRVGGNRQLEEQLAGVDQNNKTSARFARIYGFSYEGVYYDLPRPALFLVHGRGVPASEYRTGLHGVAKRARAPGEPSLTGLGVAEFQFADDIRVWSYDKADYTIRMDVETGMFEQVLFDLVAGDGGGRVSGAMVSGAMVRGAMVRGAMVRGAMVRGAMVRGAMARGGRGDASD